MRDYRTQKMQQVKSKTTGTYIMMQVRLLLSFIFLVINFLLLFLQLARLVSCFNQFALLKTHTRIN